MTTLALKGHTFQEIERRGKHVRYRCTQCKGIATCLGGAPPDDPTVARIPTCQARPS